jgi:hypothetical protein
MRPIWLTLVCALALRTDATLTVDDVNEQFMTIGVFSHQFDALQDPKHFWKSKVNSSLHTFTSVSLVSQAFPYFFSTSLGGMLFSSNFILANDSAAVRCAYACDGNTMGRAPTGCSDITQQSGSLPIDSRCGVNGLPATAYRTIDDMLVRLNPQPNTACVWTPTDPYPGADVDAMGRVRPPPGETPLEHFDCRYNEIVLDADDVNDAFPKVLDAFFYTRNCYRSPRAHLSWLPTTATDVETVFNDFLKTYKAQMKHAPLLLELDCSKLARGEPPFTLPPS